MEHHSLVEFIERARGVERRRELERNAVVVLDALERAGVRTLLLKGPALVRLLYEEAEQRGYSDIDILVPASELASARETLIGLGYKNSRELLGIEDVAGIQHSEVWARRSGSGPLWIDLHWRLSGCDAPGDIVWEALASECFSIQLEGHPTAVPAPPGLAFHLAVHAAQHGPRDTKALGDLARGIERWPLDIWGAAAHIAREVEAIPAFAAGLRLLASGKVIATRLNLPATPVLDWEIAHREHRPRGAFHLQALARARGPRQLVAVVGHAIMPARAWIIWEFPWAARSRLLLVVAYLRHNLRAPSWGWRAWRYRRRARRERR